MNSSSPLLCLVGPTAVGKSAVALNLAPQIHAEIVSADSMQVYRGMNIGTAKPSPAEQARVRHHLIDVAEPGERFDVARYRELALAAITDIRARGKTPLVVGGSGMYLRALTEGLLVGPSADPQLREQLAKSSDQELHAQLAKLDPVAAQKIPAQNKRRVIRALEVMAGTGQKFSAQQTQWEKLSLSSSSSANIRIVGLQRERAELQRRIEARVEAMFAAGFVEEVRGLLARGLEQNPTAMQAAGYQEVVALLRGTLSLAQAKVLTATRTRQLAKRQLTWFRHQATVTWIDVRANESLESILARVATVLPRS